MIGCLFILLSVCFLFQTMTDEECKGEDSSKSFLCVENISGDGLLTNLFDMESGEFFYGFLPFQCLSFLSFLYRSMILEEKQKSN